MFRHREWPASNPYTRRALIHLDVLVCGTVKRTSILSWRKAGGKLKTGKGLAQQFYNAWWGVNYHKI